METSAVEKGASSDACGRVHACHEVREQLRQHMYRDCNALRVGKFSCRLHSPIYSRVRKRCEDCKVFSGQVRSGCSLADGARLCVTTGSAREQGSRVCHESVHVALLRTVLCARKSESYLVTGLSGLRC